MQSEDVELVRGVVPRDSRAAGEQDSVLTLRPPRTGSGCLVRSAPPILPLPRRNSQWLPGEGHSMKE